MNKALNAEPNCKKAANCNYQFDKELEIFMNGGPRGVYLNNIYQSLLTIAPTSVESERSVSGMTFTKVRSSLSDESINAMLMLKIFFQNKN